MEAIVNVLKKKTRQPTLNDIRLHMSHEIEVYVLM